MKEETEEQRLPLQKPSLISTGDSARNKSIWRFQGGRKTPSAGPENPSKNEDTAVAETVSRSSALEESLTYREDRPDGEHEASDGSDPDAEIECRGCKKIWKNERRKQDPSSVVPVFEHCGESRHLEYCVAFQHLIPSSQTA